MDNGAAHRAETAQKMQKGELNLSSYTHTHTHTHTLDTPTTQALDLGVARCLVYSINVSQHQLQPHPTWTSKANI